MKTKFFLVFLTAICFSCSSKKFLDPPKLDLESIKTFEQKKVLEFFEGKKLRFEPIEGTLDYTYTATVDSSCIIYNEYTGVNYLLKCKIQGDSIKCNALSLPECVKNTEEISGIKLSYLFSIEKNLEGVENLDLLAELDYYMAKNQFREHFSQSWKSANPKVDILRLFKDVRSLRALEIQNMLTFPGNFFNFDTEKNEGILIEATYAEDWNNPKKYKVTIIE